jgi:hypothetical protein
MTVSKDIAVETLFANESPNNPEIHVTTLGNEKHYTQHE